MKQLKIMINVIVISVLGFFVQYVFGNEGLLSKFHQHGYKIKDVRIDIISYDEDIYAKFECKPFKYNRTTTVHNFTAKLKVDVKDNVEAVVQAYKFLSNEYRHFPVRFQINAKKAFNSNAAGMQRMIKCGNLTDFYFNKDITYRVCNFYIDETQFPPLIPNGKYKLECQVLYFNKEISVMVMYFEVYTPIPYPKNPKLAKH